MKPTNLLKSLFCIPILSKLSKNFSTHFIYSHGFQFKAAHDINHNDGELVRVFHTAPQRQIHLIIVGNCCRAVQCVVLMYERYAHA